MENQTTIFDMLYPKKKITKSIRLIECFGGYGSQALALKYLGVPFEHWKLVEWAVKSIQAYKDIHCDDVETYSDFMDKDTLVDILYNLGISQNYNDPMKKEQIARLNEKQLRTIYDNIKTTHNLVNIQQVKGKDLEIVDTDKYEYIMTYSFPCQDLSLAGKGKGMSDTTTRSGMLWEVERILTECHELGNMPQILLMENVPQVHSEDNLQDFNKWKDRLVELGYKNYFQDLIATDYGIPQTRNRCFMISLLGDHSYTFPKPIPLKLKLKDLLEDNVDEKYYLSDKMYKYIINNNLTPKSKEKTQIAYSPKSREFKATGWLEKAPSLVARDYKEPKIVYDSKILIKNATAQGYLEATNGDGVDLAQPNSETRRGRVQKELIQTLTTQNNLGVVNNMRIRKLTPRECFRLMGVKDEDYEKCAKNQSDSSLVHMAGDSIVVNVLMAIFKELI